MFWPMSVAELCIKLSYIGSKIIKVAAIFTHTKCVKMIESQVLASCCKVNQKSF
jgi:hypothetical protein